MTKEVLTVVRSVAQEELNGSAHMRRLIGDEVRQLKAELVSLEEIQLLESFVHDRQEHELGGTLTTLRLLRRELTRGPGRSLKGLFTGCLAQTKKRNRYV